MRNLLLLFIIALPAALFAQTDTTRTPRRDIVTTLREMGAAESVKSVQKYEEEKTGNRQRAVLERIRSLSQQTKILLKRGIDTVSFDQSRVDAKRSLETVKDGILVNKGSSQTQRNLEVSAAIVNELYARITDQKKALQIYAAKVTALRMQIDSVSSDPSLFVFPADSASAMKQIRRLYLAAREVNPIDSALDKAVTLVEEQQLKTDYLLFDISAVREDIDIYSGHLARQSFEKEFPYLWAHPVLSRPLSDIIRFSFAKEMILLRFYVEDHVIRLFLVFLLLMGSWYFLRSLKKQVQRQHDVTDARADNLVIVHPFATAVVLTLSIFQFLFASPPFIFSFALWLMAAISLGFIFKGFISAYWQRFWIVTTALFLLAGVDNMILQVSRPERYLMLLISLGGCGYLTALLLNKNRTELKEKKILYFIIIFLVFEVCSSFLNLMGRFNVAKSLMISGYISLTVGVVFLWVIRLINEGLVLASGVYKTPSRQLFYLNFQRVGPQAPGIFYVALTVGWLLIVARNFYHLRGYAASVNTFITAERSLGDYNYSITGLLIFIFVLFCSLMLSRLVSYFATEQDHTIAAGKRSKGFSIGSWLLVIRIFIITVGVILAFAAAGIPMDKFAIVLGALGVGVGLGLQGLVNNLVSGLIISFEKPVNVGDIIELNGKFATVKSIGFRSSVVKSSEGANLIIPNGDLLSQQLTNWTMGHNLRRSHLTVGVAYETDIDRARGLLQDILKKDERILTSPAPAVFFTAFGDSSIEIELIYWNRDINESLIVKSDLISEIFQVFKKEQITIPFPQQEIHIKTDTSPGKEEAEGD
ncbi:mechanosensitive ion channel family protein [Chitinophaga arvensicola]|nr:mechanosensitive ion channel domain-containing protein [Chitinophaga arvensicola]